MLSIAETIKYRGDYENLKLRKTLLKVAQPVDNGRHDLQSRYLLGDIVAIQILFSEKLNNLFNLAKVLAICILRDNGLDIFASCLTFLLVPKSHI